MSDIQNPDQRFPKPEIIDETVSEAASTQPLESNSAIAGEGWQTVDFPDALKLDTIPNETLPDDRNIELAALVETLQRENCLLQQQVVQLENHLTQLQVQTQIEALRREEVTVTTPAPHSLEEVLVAQEQVARLFQELELSHQVSQRQQVLVEALQTELGYSQAQVSQLEQECAIAQQRYAESQQQRLQAESHCRDLQMRLHRQQQQTLQFKAALEQSLEISAQQSVQPLVASHSDSVDPSVEPELAESTTLQPMTVSNPPVKPWSVPAGRATTRFNDSLLKPLAKLLEQDATDAIAPVTNDEAFQKTEIQIEQIFPKVQTSTDHIDSVPNEIFDVQPFILASESEAQAVTPEPNMWSDLANLIDSPSTSSANPTTHYEDSDSKVDSTSSTPESDLRQPDSAEKVENPAVNVQFNLANYRNLRVPESPAAQSVSGDQSSEVPSDLAQSSPSPVIYPQRTAKKRQSLAAVELPTFPRNPS
jgi:hypothetical protein